MKLPSFSPYEKMARSLTKASKKETRMVEKQKWVVTEKIHGANFSFVFHQGTISFAKRRGYLSWEENFFGFQTMASVIERNVQSLFDEVASTEGSLLETTDDNNFQIILYGELFGGKYPHPDVERKYNIDAIQSGIYYSPDICFCAFDIAIVMPPATKLYLGYERCVELFQKHGIFYARPLFTGPLVKALDFNTRFDSTIPKELGLPQLTPNLVEGIVVKPYCAGSNADSRIIFKTTNKEFDEDEQYRQNQRWDRDVMAPMADSLSIQTAAIVQECVRMVTSLRLDSAITKVGSLIYNVEEVKEEVRLDILATFEDQSEIERLTAKEREWIEGRIDAATDRFVARAQLLNKR